MFEDGDHFDKCLPAFEMFKGTYRMIILSTKQIICQSNL